jgi:hypothetical protein
MGFSLETIAAVGVGDRDDEEADATGQQDHVQHALFLPCLIPSLPYSFPALFLPEDRRGYVVSRSPRWRELDWRAHRPRNFSSFRHKKSRWVGVMLHKNGI